MTRHWYPRRADLRLGGIRADYIAKQWDVFAIVLKEFANWRSVLPDCRPEGCARRRSRRGAPFVPSSNVSITAFQS